MTDSGKSQTRVALVTGGARRVGRAIVERLIEAGFDVAFTYNTSTREADDLTEFARASGRRALSISADLTEPAAAAAGVAAAFRNTFDRLDLLVNNAASFEPSSLAGATPAAMALLWNLHVVGPLLLCREFETMLRAGRGSVVNMVDALAEKPWPKYLGYCASKAGLWNLTLGLAREFAPDATVNGIAPGVVEWSGGESQEARERYLARVPLGRAGTPRDVAELVHFLCTEGRYVTGQIIRLDGGKSVR